MQVGQKTIALERSLCFSLCNFEPLEYLPLHFHCVVLAPVLQTARRRAKCGGPEAQERNHAPKLRTCALGRTTRSILKALASDALPQAIFGARQSGPRLGLYHFYCVASGLSRCRRVSQSQRRSLDILAAKQQGVTMRISEPGNSVYLGVGIWYDERQGHIHITAKGVPGFHTTVAPDPRSKRGHPNLFEKLAKCLRDSGAPAPAKVSDDS